MPQGQSNWKGNAVSNIEVELDIQLLAASLAKNPAFVKAVADAIRNAMLRDARSMGTLFRQWGGSK